MTVHQNPSMVIRNGTVIDGTGGPPVVADVAIAGDHRLIDRGPYRLIRHPSYAGALLALAGFGLAMGSVPALAALLVPTLAAYHYRITVEEAALLHGLGAAYADYMRRTWRLIPGLY